MSNDKTYNGWTNYETWLVKLWMDNDQGSYNFNQERAQEFYNEAEAGDCFTKEEQAVLDLAAAMRDEYEEFSQDLVQRANVEASVWSDLITSALQEVNWHEIARALIEETDKEPAEAED